ncbi:MAG: starch-binding protein, partial [Ruminococcus sp.]|nr:starch-binding protein [Ruminococcus sp.]
ETEPKDTPAPDPSEEETESEETSAPTPTEEETEPEETTVPTPSEKETEPEAKTFSFKFTNNQNWKNVYVYAWDESKKALTSAWPGDQVKDSEKNGYGEEVYTITIPANAVGCVINNGEENAAQTVDIEDFDVEGYYTKANDTNDKGHYNVYAWDDGDKEDPKPSETDPKEDGATVYLNGSDYSSGGTVWFAWTWTGDADGHWVKASDQTNTSKIKFEGIEEKVIFVRMNPEYTTTEPDWKYVWNQTEDVTVTGNEGKTYKITGWHNGKDENMGGSWA